MLSMCDKDVIVPIASFVLMELLSQMRQNKSGIFGKEQYLNYEAQSSSK
jgi:hypothetical protein